MTLPTVDADGHAIIDERWLQGRTSYGGATAAIALAAVKAAFDDLPPLRSMQIAFVGPLSGNVTATPVLLRRGKNSAFVGCDVVGADGLGLRALFLFMASRESELAFADMVRPSHTPPEDGAFDGSTIGPSFLANFEFARAGDPQPGQWLRWVRLKDRSALSGDIELVAIADALPPAAMSLARQWGPISTTTWQLNLVTDAPLTDDGWWLIEAHMLHAGHGSSSQAMTIWNRAGQPVATATQSVAIFV